MAKAYFTSRTFSFLSQLAANNNREWFQANKPRYEAEVRDPALRFVNDFAPRLHEISSRFRADPRAHGGSLFRIYRDTRFSKDKTPYKTHTGIHFRHEASKNAHAPGFYLHIAPQSCFMGCGIWRPAGAALRRIRESIDEDPDGWIRASTDAAFTRSFELSGDSLVRAPKGYSIDHPMIVDLRRKDFIGVSQLGADALTADDFLDAFTALCRDGAPLQRWLCKAIGVPY